MTLITTAYANRPGRTSRLLSCPLNSASVSVRVLYVCSMVCSRSIWGSLLLWRTSGGTISFLCKGQQPVLVEHVATWYAGHQDVEEYCRRRDISTRPFFVGASSGEPGRSAQAQGAYAEFAPGRSKRSQRPRRYRYSVRTDSKTIALRAFWSMHVEAMNWSGMGHAEYAAAPGLSPHALRIWRNRLEESGEEINWRSLPHPSARAQLYSAANCTRRTYRLTEQAVDGRSNRRRSATAG